MTSLNSEEEQGHSGASPAPHPPSAFCRAGPSKKGFMSVGKWEHWATLTEGPGSLSRS